MMARLAIELNARIEAKNDSHSNAKSRSGL